MKDVGVAKTRSLGRTAGRTEGHTDGITHTRTDQGHFYSPLRLRRLIIKIPVVSHNVFLSTLGSVSQLQLS